MQLRDGAGGWYKRNSPFLEQTGIADQDLFAVPAGLGAAARQGLKISCRNDPMALLPGGLYDRIGQGMLGAGFDIGGQGQQIFCRQGMQGQDVRDHRSSLGQRAGFIQSDGLDGSHFFEIYSAFNKNSVACGSTDRTDDRRRRRHHQGAGAGDDQQSQAAVDPRLPLQARQQRRQEHNACRQRHHYGRVHGGEFFYERLRQGPFGLCSFDHMDDPGNGRIPDEAGDFHFQGAVSVQRPGEHRRAG